MIRIGKCLRKSGDSTRTRFKSEHANLSVSEKVSCYMNFINKTEVAKERFGMKASFKTVLNLFFIAF